MNKISIKPFIYTALIGTTLGLGACKKEKAPIEKHYTTLPDTFTRSDSSKSEPIFGDTLLVFDDVVIPKRVRQGATRTEFIDGMKKLYPEDKYTYNARIRDGEDIANVDIVDKRNPDNNISISFHDSKVIPNSYHTWGSFKINNKSCMAIYNELGEIYSLSDFGKDYIYTPLMEDIYKELNKRNILGLRVSLENLLPNIKKITPGSIGLLDSDYRSKVKNQDEGLVETIDQATWLDDDVKAQCLEHLDYCYSTNDDSRANTDEEETQIINYYYEGDKYTKKTQDGVLTVKNLRTGKETSLNLNESFNKLNVRNKNVYKYLIQNLPAEVIEDIAIEVGDQFYQGYTSKEARHFKNAFAYYSGSNNIVKILKPIYRDNISQLVHEVGHALDCTFENGKNEYSSAKFKETFEKELKKYKDAGGEVYSDDNNSSMYSTKDWREMFAEMYTVLMLGESKYDYKTMLKNFPETFEAAKELIKHIRSLPVELRNKDYKEESVQK